MATKEFPLEPVAVPKVQTNHRRIQTMLPVPESLPLLRRLRESECRSMRGQPPIIWARGDGVHVHDPYGNMWLDFSSGVLVTACGHGHPDIVRAIQAAAGTGIYHAYNFPTEVRAELAAKISSLVPRPLKEVFLLTTGSEAVECCIKLARTHGQKLGGPRKTVLVTFDNAFHGRTMGAQLAGGSAALKSWIGPYECGFVQVPYPDGFRQKDESFEVFTRSLADKGVAPDQVCGVMSETYQGCNAKIMPPAYAQALRRWCDQHGALLIFDEIQAGFGRTGTWFGFQHTGVVPDLAAFGKGISGGMPLAAVVGRSEIMNQYGPGEMTSTHSANPICCAAALANIEVIQRENLVENAARLGPVLAEGVRKTQEFSHGRVGRVDAVGLVAAVQFTRPGTTEPDAALAWDVCKRIVESGVMLFSPVGVGGCCLKICPPLTIGEEALREGLEVIREVTAAMTAP